MNSCRDVEESDNAKIKSQDKSFENQLSNCDADGNVKSDSAEVRSYPIQAGKKNKKSGFIYFLFCISRERTFNSRP